MLSFWKGSPVLILLMICLLVFPAKRNCFSQLPNQNKKHTVYLIPGQGADYRLFGNLQLDSCYRTVFVHYPVPNKGESMNTYAERIALQIDTTQEFSLIGVSLGGMLSVELNEIIHPGKTIIISSAKSRSELPVRYKFLRFFPLNHVVPPQLYKIGAQIAQPVVEPDRKNGREVFVAMLKAKDPDFLKRSVNMIIHWNRKSYHPEIIHIHGTNDHTLPLRHINADYEIKNGSHMMTFTKGREISELINRLLSE